MKFISRDLIKRIKSNGIDAWTHWAGEWYSVHYSMYDKTQEELRWLKRLRNVLDKTLPDGWRNSVNAIGVQGCMGEDVYCVDGNLEHTLHCFHNKCLNDKIVCRGEKRWCVDCDCYVDRADILSPEELTATEVKKAYSTAGLNDLGQVSVWWSRASLGYHEKADNSGIVKEVMQTLYDAILAIAPREGIVDFKFGYIVNGKPATRLCRDCYKCKKKSYTCGVHESVYSVFVDGPFEERKQWCENCKCWTKLRSM